MASDLIVAPSPDVLPAALFAPSKPAARRFIEFFTAQINNDHTRKSYLNATKHFAEWCETHGLHELVDVEPFHVAAFVKDLQGKFSAPTVKQHLAALRMLFDWLVTGQVIATNPAHAVRGPKYVVKRGKTPVLASDEARALLDSIEVSTLKGESMQTCGVHYDAAQTGVLEAAFRPRYSASTIRTVTGRPQL
jgi:site-specific recombinase XerD